MSIPPQLQRYAFKKGQSGNPNGRVPTRGVRSRLMGYLSENAIDFPFLATMMTGTGPDPEYPDHPLVSEEQFKSMQLGDCLALASIYWAIRGKGPMFSELMDRIEGKVPQKMLIEEGTKPPSEWTDDEMYEFCRRAFAAPLGLAELSSVVPVGTASASPIAQPSTNGRA